MFVPHIVVGHRRRDGKKPSPRQRLVGVLAAALGAGISAGIGAASSKHSTHDLVVLVCIVAGIALVAGILVARAIGHRSRV